MKQYKAILFDLDGTLLDTSEGVISSVQYTIDVYGRFTESAKRNPCVR